MTNKYCSNCGEPAVSPTSNACANCGKPYDLSQAEPERENVNSAEKRVCVKEKSTFFAVVLSFAFPGLGQVYNGRLKKGLLLMAVYWVGLFFMGIPTLIAWLYSIFNANSEAEKINKGELPFVEATGKDAIIFLAAYFITAVIVFIIMYVALIFLFLLPLMMYGY
jgi:TM2 domain.